MRDLSYFRKDSLEFGTESTANYEVVLLAPPDRTAPVRAVEKVEIPGRSGDLVYDLGRYNNVSISYRCAIVPTSGVSLRKAATKFLNVFAPSAGYRRLIDSFDPGHFRLARIREVINIESIAERAGRFTLEFDQKPQRFLVSGENAMRFSSSGAVIYCPTSQVALPLITVYGTGPGVLTVGSVTVEIKELTDLIILDSDRQNAYRQAGNGGKENKNGCIYAPKFPVLNPGENILSWTGGISSVQVVPRWWEL